jgi:hypothetical protein
MNILMTISEHPWVALSQLDIAVLYKSGGV